MVAKISKKDKDYQDEYRGKEERSEEPAQLASTLAARHIINPGRDKLQEVSYLSFGLVHPLTMNQAFEQPMQTIIDQITERRLWYLSRFEDRLRNAKIVKDGKIVNKWTQDQILEKVTTAKEEMDLMSKELDEVDISKLFPSELRKSVYQHSRGKDGKFIESLTILADTDMQTRAGDEGSGDFSNRPRSQ